MGLNSVENHYKLAIKDIKKLKANLNLLEIGAGNHALKEFLPENITYETLDYASDFYGKKNTFDHNLNEGKIPIKDKSYDIIVCNDVLEHIMYPETVLKDIQRITKDDAIFFFSLPNEYNFVMRLYYLFSIKTKTEEPFKVVEKGLHIHKPRVKDIINLFSKDFNIKKIEYVWQSRKSSASGLFRGIDKFFQILAKIYPSLFSRVVVVKLTKK